MRVSILAEDLVGRRSRRIENSTNMALAKTFTGAVPVAFGAGSDDVYADMLAALLAGDVDAVVDDDVVFVPLARLTPTTNSPSPCTPPTSGASPVAKDRPDLLAEIDAALGRLFDSGRSAEVWRQWLPTLEYPFRSEGAPPLVAVLGRRARAGADPAPLGDPGRRAICEAVWAAGGEPLVLHGPAAAPIAELSHRLARLRRVLAARRSRSRSAPVRRRPPPDTERPDGPPGRLRPRRGPRRGRPGPPCPGHLQGDADPQRRDRRQPAPASERDHYRRHRDRVHHVTVPAGARLHRPARRPRDRVSSYHHQAVDRVAGDRPVSAVAADDGVEAVEHAVPPWSPSSGIPKTATPHRTPTRRCLPTSSTVHAKRRTRGEQLVSRVLLKDVIPDLPMPERPRAHICVIGSLNYPDISAADIGLVTRFTRTAA